MKCPNCGDKPGDPEMESCGYGDLRCPECGHMQFAESQEDFDARMNRKPTLNVEVSYLSGFTCSVYVNGERMLDSESAEVAEAVAECLRDPLARPGTESREVADQILRNLEAR